MFYIALFDCCMRKNSYPESIEKLCKVDKYDHQKGEIPANVIYSQFLDIFRGSMNKQSWEFSLSQRYSVKVQRAQNDLIEYIKLHCTKYDKD